MVIQDGVKVQRSGRAGGLRQELGLEGMTVTKHGVLPDTPAFHDEPANLFSTAAFG
jgi:hypothetical protein